MEGFFLWKIKFYPIEINQYTSAIILLLYIILQPTLLTIHTMKIRKLTFLLVIIIITPFQLFAQYNSERSSLSISIGTSVPVGDFSKTDPNNTSAGYAKTGETLTLSFGYKLTKTIGLEAAVYGQRNALNTGEYEKQLGETYFFRDERNYSNWEVEKKRWMTGSVLAGVTGEYAIDQTNKISIKAKALAGFALVKSPDLKAESKSADAYAVFSGEYGSAKGISVLLGVGIQYKLNNRFSLFLNSDYFTTRKISFKDSKEAIIATDGGLIVPGLYNIENSRNAPLSFGQIGNREQTISSLNLNTGLRLVW